MTLEKIHLIVRKNNHRALKLYRSLGFSKIGESVHAIQGKRIEFIDILITKEQFDKLQFKRILNAGLKGNKL